jgi:hypothetical protein
MPFLGWPSTRTPQQVQDRWLQCSSIAHSKGIDVRTPREQDDGCLATKLRLTAMARAGRDLLAVSPTLAA